MDVPAALHSPRRSPLGWRRPTRSELADFATPDAESLQDLLPAGGGLRMLIVGINPGLWTAAVNAPFARPGNRFWPSLHRAELTSRLVDASVGLDPEDEGDLLGRGIGITNLVGRATVRADELSTAELREGAARLAARLPEIRPRCVAIAGITAYRTAFEQRKAVLGKQDASVFPWWPQDVALWVVPQPSGLNAHENIDSLATKWRQVWEASAPAGGVAGQHININEGETG